MLLNYKNWQFECLKRRDYKLRFFFSSEEPLVLTKMFNLLLVFLTILNVSSPSKFSVQ